MWIQDFPPSSDLRILSIKVKPSPRWAASVDKIVGANCQWSPAIKAFGAQVKANQQLTSVA